MIWDFSALLFFATVISGAIWPWIQNYLKKHAYKKISGKRAHMG